MGSSRAALQKEPTKAKTFALLTFAGGKSLTLPHQTENEDFSLILPSFSVFVRKRSPFPHRLSIIAINCKVKTVLFAILIPKVLLIRIKSGLVSVYPRISASRAK